MAITVSQLNEIKKLLDTNRLVIGAERTLKLLRANKAAKVWLSSSVEAETLSDIKRLAQLNNVEVIELQHSNNELGELCRKPFAVSVISTAK